MNCINVPIKVDFSNLLVYTITIDPPIPLLSGLTIKLKATVFGNRRYLDNGGERSHI